MKVTLLMALTLDGKIAKDNDHFPNWTEKADKAVFVDLTKKAGCLIMGSKTYDTIGHPLPGRKNIILTRDKNRQSAPPDLIFTSQPPKEILNQLESEGLEEVILAGGQMVNTLFAKEGLINEIVVTISPLIFGSGLSLFDETISMKLGLKSVEKLGENSLVVVYSVLKS